MKKKMLKRGMSGLLAVLMAFTALIGMGTTAFAAFQFGKDDKKRYPVPRNTAHYAQQKISLRR